MLGRPFTTAIDCSACIGDKPISAPAWMASTQLAGLPRKSLGAKSDSATILPNDIASAIVCRARPLGCVLVEISVVICPRPFVVEKRRFVSFLRYEKPALRRAKRVIRASLLPGSRRPGPNT
jgi:hypothetical protein